MISSGLWGSPVTGQPREAGRPLTPHPQPLALTPLALTGFLEAEVGWRVQGNPLRSPWTRDPTEPACDCWVSAVSSGVSSSLGNSQISVLAASWGWMTWTGKMPRMGLAWGGVMPNPA